MMLGDISSAIYHLELLLNIKIMADVGRPSEMTELTVKKLEEAFAMDCSVSEACLNANISRTTYYEWIKNNPDLANRFEQLRNNPFLKARKTIIESLNNPQYAFEYMKRKKKDEFSDRQELSGPDGKEIGVILYPQKKDDSSLEATTETGTSSS